ncbi:ATP-binding cassette domain-containing protein [Silvanigrella paludirubra]|uniref:ATP-binding cassette domain-containing protein n=1 Tax=Silvanigrella paludirubra TaxID=2499159 RepID=A0A6N6VVQ6_9BACT|nr:ABC transporter ATP-binding protein [Silvanigrella paludirubra]KAB8038809.1 ATP-binding cassette domain-containing protein [Silvanigrella paludirubra]
MKDETVLAVENLVTSFKVSGREINAVDNCSFTVKKGKTLGIVGESGCGKSVTSLSLMRLIPNPPGKIVSGNIIFENKNLLTLSEKEMRSVRGNKISMIFQEPMTSLNPVYTIGNQIAEVFTLHKRATRKEARDLSIEMLKLVRIPSPEKRIDDYPHQLSGGMRQRVMIAIALACKPSLLIADEPTTALDVTIQAQILALMNNLQKETGMSTILITHDLGVVAETCDDVVVMYAGKIVEKSSTKELFENPKHPYTIGLLNSIPKLGEKKHRLNTIPGIVPSLSNLPKGCRFQDRCSLVSDECKIIEPELKTLKNEKLVSCFKA